jgi:hypothetical protein
MSLLLNKDEIWPLQTNDSPPLSEFELWRHNYGSPSHALQFCGNVADAEQRGSDYRTLPREKNDATRALTLLKAIKMDTAFAQSVTTIFP